MVDPAYGSFSDLYRAAFAEPDPDKKLFLLSQVKKAIDDWEQTLHNRIAIPGSAANAAEPKTAQSSSRPGKVTAQAA
jgi:hypothetical protein